MIRDNPRGSIKTPDQPFPREAAIAALVASGPLAIERALADGRIRDRGWIDEAQARLRG